MNYVTAVFAPYTAKREYTYATELDLEPGDHCITKTPSNGFQIVKIRLTDVTKPTNYKCKVLEQKVDADLQHNRTV